MTEHTRFERLLLPHLDAGYNLARWLTHDRHAAEDAVQEACLRALKYFDSFRGDAVKPWFLSIVRRSALDWIASHRRLVDDPDALDALADTADHEPEQMALRQATWHSLAAAVAALPERSVHCTVRVYRRPGPPPCLSARSRAVRSPVTWMSGAVFPSPSPFSGSLLVAETIRQAGEGSHWSETETASATSTHRWLGGHSKAGLALRLAMTGAVVSTTSICTVSVEVPPSPSSTVRVTVWLPRGRLTVGMTPVAVPIGPVHV